MQEWNFAEIIIDHVPVLYQYRYRTGTRTCTVRVLYWLLVLTVPVHVQLYMCRYTRTSSTGTDSSLILSYRGTAFLNRSIPGMMSIDSVLNPDWCYDGLSDC